MAISPVKLRHGACVLLGVGLLAGCAWSLYKAMASRADPAANSGGRFLSGRVVDEAGLAVPAARVRIKGRREFATTDAEGGFRLPVERLAADESTVTITAAKPGYLVAGVPAEVGAAGREPLLITLQALPSEDCPDYRWVDPRPSSGQDHNCGNCHGEILHEWQTSAHSRSATGRKFLNLYAGTDWHGRPGRGWSLLGEHPSGATVCTACHAPTVEFDDDAYHDLRKATGVAAQGVHCDYCHKIQDVTTENLGLTHGRFAQRLLRPGPILTPSPPRGAGQGGLFNSSREILAAFVPPNIERPTSDVQHRTRHDSRKQRSTLDVRPALTPSPLRGEGRGEGQSSPRQLFFGPLDDVDRGEDAYSPLQRESRLCAACHEGTIFGVHVYSTYSEWLASPARAAGKQCQDCHMTPTGKMTNIAPAAGGIERDPATLASHDFLPGGKAAMLRGSLEVKVATRELADGWQVRVDVVARHVGHRVPTGFIDRHLVLVIEGQDAAGRGVAATSGPVLPAASGDLVGRSGVLFAKLLTDVAGRGPIPFWRPAAEPTDTRLLPEKTASSEFVLPREAQRVRVRLIYRPFWEAVTREKDWPADEITVYDETRTHLN